MNKDKIVANNLIALSRGRGRGRGRGKGKGKNIRSKMLKMIMPLLSRENGDRLAKAIDERDTEAFQSVWDDIKSELTNRLEVTSSGIDIDKIQKELEKEFEADASGSDVSKLFIGSAGIPTYTRQLAANGYVVIGEGLVEIVDIKVKRTRKVTVEAKVSVGEQEHSLSESGAFAEACLNIVINAMSIIESPEHQ